MKAVDKPNAPEFNQALSAVGKVWGNVKMMTANPTLAAYADEGSKLLMLSCLEDINHHLDGMGMVHHHPCL